MNFLSRTMEMKKIREIFLPRMIPDIRYVIESIAMHASNTPYQSSMARFHNKELEHR